MVGAAEIIVTLPETAEASLRRTITIVLGLVAAGCVFAGLLVHQRWIAELEDKHHAVSIKVSQLSPDLAALHEHNDRLAKENELLKNELRRLRPDLKAVPQGTLRPDARPPGRDH